MLGASQLLQVLIGPISHVLHKKRTGYEYSIWIEFKNGARKRKEHPKISKFTKFESYWFEHKGMVTFKIRLNKRFLF